MEQLSADLIFSNWLQQLRNAGVPNEVLIGLIPPGAPQSAQVMSAAQITSAAQIMSATQIMSAAEGTSATQITSATQVTSAAQVTTELDVNTIYSRSTLPEKALFVLKEWFFQPLHLECPYPSKEEKDELMRKTGLDRKQLDTWFCNARRRFKQKPAGPAKKQIKTESSPDSVPMLPGQTMLPEQTLVPKDSSQMKFLGTSDFLPTPMDTNSLDSFCEEEKKRKRRERNKESARKCRNKRRLHEKEIQELVNGLTEENLQLQKDEFKTQVSLFKSTNPIKEQLGPVRERCKQELIRLGNANANDEEYLRLFRQWPYRIAFDPETSKEWRKQLLQQCIFRISGILAASVPIPTRLGLVANHLKVKETCDVAGHPGTARAAAVASSTSTSTSTETETETETEIETATGTAEVARGAGVVAEEGAGVAGAPAAGGLLSALGAVGASVSAGVSASVRAALGDGAEGEAACSGTNAQQQQSGHRHPLELRHMRMLKTINLGDLPSFSRMLADDVTYTDPMGRQLSGRGDVESAMQSTMSMIKGGFEATADGTPICNPTLFHSESAAGEVQEPAQTRVRYRVRVMGLLVSLHGNVTWASDGKIASMRSSMGDAANNGAATNASSSSSSSATGTTSDTSATSTSSGTGTARGSGLLQESIPIVAKYTKQISDVIAMDAGQQREIRSLQQRNTALLASLQETMQLVEATGVQLEQQQDRMHNELEEACQITPTQRAKAALWLMINEDKLPEMKKSMPF